MTNLTFDDGEPIDISKLQNLYQLVLDIKGEVDKNSIQNQNVKLTPFTYADRTAMVQITDKATIVTKLDYTPAKFDANAVPIVIVTPQAGPGNLDTTDIDYYVTNVNSSSADLVARYTGTAKSKTTNGRFNFIAVHMKQTIQ